MVCGQWWHYAACVCYHERSCAWCFWIDRKSSDGTPDLQRARADAEPTGRYRDGSYECDGNTITTAGIEYTYGTSTTTTSIDSGQST